MYVINYAAEHEQLVRGMEDHVQPGLHPVSAAGRAHNNHWMSLFDIDEASTGRTDMYYIGLFHLQQIHFTVMFKIRKCPILNGTFTNPVYYNEHEQTRRIQTRFALRRACPAWCNRTPSRPCEGWFTCFSPRFSRGEFVTSCV